MSGLFNQGQVVLDSLFFGALYSVGKKLVLSKAIEICCKGVTFLYMEIVVF